MAELLIPQDRFDSNRRAEIEIVPGECGRQRIFSGLGAINTKTRAGNCRGDRRRKNLPPRHHARYLALDYGLPAIFISASVQVAPAVSRLLTPSSPLDVQPAIYPHEGSIRSIAD